MERGVQRGEVRGGGDERGVGFGVGFDDLWVERLMMRFWLRSHRGEIMIAAAVWGRRRRRGWGYKDGGDFGEKGTERVRGEMERVCVDANMNATWLMIFESGVDTLTAE